MSRARKGEPRAAFERLAALETDDCVIWPYGTDGRYGSIRVGPAHRSTHVLALEQRSPRPFDGAFAIHGPCHNPACMNYRHLRWGTPAENCDDRRRDGTHLDAERNPAARLTVKRVRLLRRLSATGRWSCVQLAALYDVAPSTVQAAVSGTTWSSVA